MSTGLPTVPGLGNQVSTSPGANPYTNGISIPGTGANGSATTFQDFWNPQLGTYAIHQGADGAIAPIFNASEWGNIQKDFSGTNEVWAGGPSSGPGRGEHGHGGGGSNAPMLTIYNKGGGDTQVGYKLDPTTGYYVPSSSQGVGQDSWWQSQGFTDLALLGASAIGGPELAAAFGGGAAGAAGAGAVIGGTSSAIQGGNVLKGAALGGLTGGVASGVSGAVGGGIEGAAAGGATAGGLGAAINGGNPLVGAVVGGAGGAASSGVTEATGSQGLGAIAGKVGSTLAGGALSGSNNGGSMPGPSGTSTGGIDPNNPVNMGNNIGGGNILQGLSQLYNTYQGNQANQNIGNNLMGMYNNAGALTAPSVNATNNMISNPSSFFSSPLYQAQANLYGDQVNAGKNAAGTNGNGIDYTQKMMGFAGQQYNNTLANYNNAAQGFLGNQAKYGQDYAYGTALNNTSRAASNGGYANGLAQLFGGSGGNSLLSSLGSGASGFLKDLFGSSGPSSPVGNYGTGATDQNFNNTSPLDPNSSVAGLYPSSPVNPAGNNPYQDPVLAGAMGYPGSTDYTSGYTGP